MLGAGLQGFVQGLDQGADRRHADTTDALRQLQMSEIVNQITQRRAAEDAAGQLMAMPQGPVQLAAGMPGTPEVPGALAIPSEMAPPVGDVPAAEAVIAGQPAVASVPAVPATPPVTMQGITQEDIRTKLGAGAATALALSPQGRAAMEARGVLSDKELSSRRALAEANKEARPFMDQAVKAMDAGDLVGFERAKGAYYQRRSITLAATNPQAAEQASQAAIQSWGEAARLQKDQKEERETNEDLKPVWSAVKALMQPNGATPENFNKAMDALLNTTTKGGHRFSQTFLTQEFPKAVEKVKDPATQAFYRNWIEAQMNQAKTGTKNPARAVMDAIKASPDGLLIASRSAADGSELGKLVLKALIGEETTPSQTKIVMNEVDGRGVPREIAGPDGKMAINPAYWKAVGDRYKEIHERPERPGVQDRADDAKLSAAAREARLNQNSAETAYSKAKAALAKAEGVNSGATAGAVVKLKHEVEDRRRALEAATAAHAAAEARAGRPQATPGTLTPEEETTRTGELAAAQRTDAVRAEAIARGGGGGYLRYKADSKFKAEVDAAVDAKLKAAPAAAGPARPAAPAPAAAPASPAAPVVRVPQAVDMRERAKARAAALAKEGLADAAILERLRSEGLAR